MKKIITKVAVAAILAFGVNPLYAGAGHDHGHSHSQEKISEAKAKEIAIRAVKNYTLNGKLDKSWENVPIDTIKKQTYQSAPEWAVTFKNQKESNMERQKLYVFVNQYGEMTGANFTGQ
ncbi:DUF6488 family protein [Sulfurimonas sp.]|uniref:DUF6488 family protein n=1 Tax=Sulfurimonas sp. TaxID=2022749 RepID=UPI0019E52EE3|nr:DUF6488 family protein [Sulfurimonas sp.]MBE0514016.1 hypothetical protein [Sulfurimonas sp.]